MPTEHQHFLPESLPDDPLRIANDWIADATEQETGPNPNAMVFSTCAPDGMPSSRVLLCKELVADPGYLVFFTNYLSAKGQEIETNPKASVVFHWDQLHRQIRLQGLLVKSPANESDTYFESRPWQRQLGAWASHQSQPLGSMAEMQEKVEKTARELDLDIAALEKQGLVPAAIPRPKHWGGYRLWISSVELWVEGAGRVHDRGLWTRELTPAGPDDFQTGRWQSTRLQP